MERIKRALRQPGFQITAAIFFLLILNWPLISIVSAQPSIALPIYMFSIWMCFMVALFLISRSLADSD